jgi:quinol monooxygenase YgiN
MNTQKYGLHGKLKAVSAKGDDLATILAEASELMRTAKGCHLYLVSKDSMDENSVWVTEVWDSKEDHDNSLHIKGVQELISRAAPLLHGRPEKGLELRIIAGI